MKKKRIALLNSVLALLLCVAMLAGSTFAWFTDEVVSTGNIIQSGTLDVELEYWNGSDWKTVQGATKLFGEDLWEPGYTEVLYLKVSNQGNLALKWQLAINIISEDPGTNKAGESFKLSDHIYMGVVEGVQPEYASREAAVEAVKDNSGIIGKGFSGFGEMEAGAAEQYLAVVVYMPTNVDNVANHNGEDDATIDMGISLLATQKTAESDSFGSDYDAAAKHPLGDINYTAAQSVKEKTDDQGNLNEAVTVGNEGDEIHAEVPAGVKLADGAEELELTVQAMNESKANVTLENGETAASLDVHMEGVAEDNTVPMLIKLEGLMRKGLNTTSVAMYHVEDGVTVPMTLVTNPTNHNEFSYDPATGDVVMCVATFSEYVAVTDNRNPWEGKANTAWYDANKDEFTLTTAEQLAGLGVLVDGGTTFTGKTVKLGADIDLYGTDEDGNILSFNPIGCGYVNGVTNSNNVPGRAFMGTFDGGIYDEGGKLTGTHTISGLYQNGWDLGLSYCTLGGGLFASIANGTVKNLTISGANIVMECVEMGVLVGLSQGNCTYNNINIYGCKIANYQRATGGLIGEVSLMRDDEGNVVDSKQTITNVKIDPTTVVGSLWGDFDAPVGGVIGARWDAGITNAVIDVKMENVSVACRLDVYNDVTSTYEWYAYRRAGMLIGNTDTPPADGKNAKVATADFLTCENVVVVYGDWVNYHYCEFNNHNPNWPWVRVEAGENCNAYSNPRYGVPNDPVTNQPVTSLEHNHTNGDEHYVELKFNQLYGGGQGVYGQPEHTNVTIGKYTITYIHDGEVLDVVFVPDNTGECSTENSTAKALVDAWVKKNTDGNVTFGGWMNAGSTKVENVPAGNTDNIILYPSFTNLYTATFVDQQGNVLGWTTFTTREKAKLVDLGKELVNTGKVPQTDELVFDYWMVHVTDAEGNTTSNVKLDSYTLGQTDIAIYPVYKYSGTVSLIPVDEDGDGDTDFYQVSGYGNGTGFTLVEIPGSVNGVPVTEINANAFSSYADLHSVVIPANVNTIGSQSFAEFEGTIFKKRQTVTLYFEGTPEKWNSMTKASDWDNAMGEGSAVFFVGTDGKVDLTKGYWELANTGFIRENFVWQFHNHPYPYDRAVHSCNNEHNNTTNYSGACDCDNCNGATRPDAEYWPVDANS